MLDRPNPYLGACFHQLLHSRRLRYRGGSGDRPGVGWADDLPGSAKEGVEDQATLVYARPF